MYVIGDDEGYFYRMYPPSKRTHIVGVWHRGLNLSTRFYTRSKAVRVAESLFHEGQLSVYWLFEENGVFSAKPSVSVVRPVLARPQGR